MYHISAQFTCWINAGHTFRNVVLWIFIPVLCAIKDFKNEKNEMVNLQLPSHEPCKDEELGRHSSSNFASGHLSSYLVEQGRAVKWVVEAQPHRCCSEMLIPGHSWARKTAIWKNKVFAASTSSSKAIFHFSFNSFFLLFFFCLSVKMILCSCQLRFGCAFPRIHWGLCTQPENKPTVPLYKSQSISLFSLRCPNLFGRVKGTPFSTLQRFSVTTVCQQGRK